MTKILRGYTFKSVLLYCEGRGEKDEAPEGRLIGGNMVGGTVRELLDEFLTVRRMRPDIEKTTWHNSLRLPPGDHLDDEKWRVVVGDYMQRMGFSPAHPYCIWSHDDEGAVHIIASRIGFDGRVYLGQNENLASTRHIQDLERAHGLRLTKGPEYIDPNAEPEALRPVPRERAALRKSEIDQAVRTDQEPPKARLQRLIDAAVADAPSVVELAERLVSEGVLVRANLASTGTFNGFSFELAGVPFKGSELGKGYAWKGLQAKGVTYEQARDRESLERFSTAARATAGNDGPASADFNVDRPGGPARSDADAVGSGVQRSESEAASADAGSRRSDRADRAGAGADPATAAGAGRAPGQARGGNEPGNGRPALAGAREGWGAPGAAKVGQQSGFAGAAGAGVGGKADDVREALSKDHQVKILAWREQAAALGAPVYRVSLIGRTGAAAEKRINLGKSRTDDQPETFYDAAEVEALIPQLRRRNATGFDVYVTPIDQAHHYLVIDDMKPGAARLLAGLGHASCLVQSSSQDNEQAVIKVPKVDRDDEQSLANKLVQQLNMAHGDPKFSGVVHPFRMAGFSNKKIDRGNAFTRILEAGHRICQRAAELLQQLRQTADDLATRHRRLADQERIEVDAQRQAKRSVGRDRLEVLFDRGDDAERAFRRSAAGVRAWVKLRGLTEDASRVDFRAALAMLDGGWTSTQVQAGMLAGSDDLVGRHTDPTDYVQRTVRKAGIEHAAKPSASAASALPRNRGG
jgi:hypothetical protein